MTANHSNTETRSIEIPASTAAAITERVEGTEFETVDEYVTAALEQLLDQLHRHDSGDGYESSTDDATENRDTEESVETRLESLGYL